MKNPNFKTKLPAEKVLGLAKRYNGITCSPHPYAPGWVSVINNIKNGTFSEKIFSKFDVIEAMTGASLRAYNLRSSLLAYNLGKPMSGGLTAGWLQPGRYGHAETWGKRGKSGFNVQNPKENCQNRN
jgi:hypothetical protein